MGKSLNGKELGKGITQRKDGLYQARFTNRFGKRQTIYAKTVTEITKKLREEQYHDEKQINVVDTSMTLNEWFDKWLSTCKKHCRDTTIRTYTIQYNRLSESLGWRKLSKLNLVIMQELEDEIRCVFQHKSNRADRKKGDHKTENMGNTLPHALNIQIPDINVERDQLP